jgi:hypothetical protein
VCPQHIDTFETEVTQNQSTLPAKQSMIVTTKYEFVLRKHMRPPKSISHVQQSGLADTVPFVNG